MKNRTNGAALSPAKATAVGDWIAHAGQGRQPRTDPMPNGEERNVHPDGEVVRLHKGIQACA